MKANYTILTVAVSALTAFAVVVPSLHQARAAEKTSGKVTQIVNTRSVPVQQIGEFDKIFAAKLNQAITDSGSAARGFWAIRKHVGPDWITDSIVYWPDARAMSRDELVKLRSQIGAELRNAAGRKTDLAEIANGELSANFFRCSVHKISKAAEQR
jgi:hypothetical protein